MNLKTKAFLAIIGCFPVFLYSQNVLDVKGLLDNDEIKIFYTISGGNFHNYYTTNLFVSTDNGLTFHGPMEKVSGEIGEGIRRGKHECIWDAESELPPLSQDYIFRIQAEVFERGNDKSFFIAYSGNQITPFGLKFGILDKIGWYTELRISSSPFNKSSYTSDGELADYDKPGYYEFNGDGKYSAFSLLAGIVFPLSNSFYIHLGVGYGKEEYHWQIDEYDYNNALTGQSWVKDTENSINGFEMNIGGILRFNKFLISGGIMTIRLQTFNWIAGIGVAF